MERKTLPGGMQGKQGRAVLNSADSIFLRLLSPEQSVVMNRAMISFSQQCTHFIRILSNSLLVVAIYDIFSGTGTSLMCMLAQVLHAYWLLSFYA